MPRQKKKERPIRLSLSLSPKVKNRLEKLQDLCEADSMTEVIRRSLAVYEVLLENQHEGGVTFVREQDGREREVLVF